jgi:hypothetical protein
MRRLTLLYEIVLVAAVPFQGNDRCETKLSGAENAL